MDISRTVFREDHEMFRATARRFLERECVPRQEAWDEAGNTAFRPISKVTAATSRVPR